MIKWYHCTDLLVGFAGIKYAVGWCTDKRHEDAISSGLLAPPDSEVTAASVRDDGLHLLTSHRHQRRRRFAARAQRSGTEGNFHQCWGSWGGGGGGGGGGEVRAL